MFFFFQKRKKTFLGANKQLKDIEINLNRNFLGKFRNISLRYALITNRGTKILRARAHKLQDTPEREWKVLNFLRKFNLARNLAKPVDYFSPLNIFFYEEAPGICGEKLLAERKIKPLLGVTPELAQVFKKIHSIKYKKNLLPIKDNGEDLKERRHWYFLVRKCCPELYSAFSQLLKTLWQFRCKNEIIFKRPLALTHQDFHWGNVIISERGPVKIIDFSYTCYSDPFEDVGGFIAQTESMFRYYAPQFMAEKEKIIKIFLENYFQRAITPADKKALFYFIIRKNLEIAAVLSFVISDKKAKVAGVKNHLAAAEREIKFLNF